MVSAYSVGYDRGRNRAAVPEQTKTTSTAPTSPARARSGPPRSATEVLARGETLYASDGCAACHSLDGSAGAGPSLDGVAGRNVELTDGLTVTADRAYLTRAIADPDSQIVKGYRAGVMSAAISGFGLDGKPGDVHALVAFLEAQK